LFISAQAVALIDAEKMVQLWRVDTAHSLAVRDNEPLSKQFISSNDLFAKTFSGRT
jgi:hypothetical protein